VTAHNFVKAIFFFAHGSVEVTELVVALSPGYGPGRGEEFFPRGGWHVRVCRRPSRFGHGGEDPVVRIAELGNGEGFFCGVGVVLEPVFVACDAVGDFEVVGVAAFEFFFGPCRARVVFSYDGDAAY